MSSYDGSLGSSAAQEPDTLYCANHPNVPTYLRCGRCGKPICAKCRVATPVGHRCIECARLSVVPTYAVSSNHYLKAAAAGVGVATLIGALWGVLPGFEFWAALLMGIAVSEAVSAAVNMKRGPGLQAVGIAAVVWGILFSRLAMSFAARSQPPLIMDIPGNDRLRNFLVTTRPDFLEIWQPPLTDLTSLVFLLLAFGLTFIRLR